MSQHAHEQHIWLEWNRSFTSVIRNACVYPASSCQNGCCYKGLWEHKNILTKFAIGNKKIDLGWNKNKIRWQLWLLWRNMSLFAWVELPKLRLSASQIKFMYSPAVPSTLHTHGYLKKERKRENIYWTNHLCDTKWPSTFFHSNVSCRNPINVKIFDLSLIRLWVVVFSITFQE